MKDATREPLPAPFPVGARLRCVEGHDAYAARVACPREHGAHPEDWARVAGRGLEVTIDRVEAGRRGTGRQLRDEQGPMVHEDGEPILDETQDGYSVYRVALGTGDPARTASRCIRPDGARRWEVLPAPLRPLPGDFLGEGAPACYGVVLAAGSRTFDVLWVGGSTTRYRLGARDLRIVPSAELDAHTRDHLLREAEAARRERRAGARIRRGTVSPRR